MPKFSKERKAEIDAAVKQEVLDAVVRILKVCHSARITIDMLAEESGISKGTLYNHFKNKGDIIAYAITKYFEPIDLAQARIVDSDLGVLEKLRLIIEMRITKYAELFERIVLMANNMSLPDTSQPIVALNSSRKRTMLRLQSILADGVRQGLFRNIEMKYLVAAFLGLRRGAELWRRQASKSSANGIVKDIETVMGIFMRGVAIGHQHIVPGVASDYSVKVEDTIKDRAFSAVMNILRNSHIDRISAASISMNMLAGRVGISKPILYKHFANKDDLLAYVMRKSIESHEKAMTERVNADTSVVEKLMAFAEVEMNKRDDTKGIAHIATNSASLLSCHKVIEKSWKHSNECLLGIMRQGLSEGFFRNIGANNLVLCLKHIIIVLIGYKEFYEKTKFVSEEAAVVVDVFLNGVAAHSDSSDGLRN